MVGFVLCLSFISLSIINKEAEALKKIEDKLQNKIKNLESKMALSQAEMESKIASLKENINKNITEMISHIEDQMQITSKVDVDTMVKMIENPDTKIDLNKTEEDSRFGSLKQDINILKGNDASQGERLFKLLIFN